MASAYFDVNYKSKLPQLMKTHNFSYYEICDNKDKVLTFCPAGLTPEQAAEFLSDNLSGFVDGEFSVSLFESARKKSVSQTFPFKLTNPIAAIGAAAPVPMTERIALEKKIWELESEKKIEGIVKGLKDEISALQKPEQGGIFGVLDNIQSIVDKYPIIGEVINNIAKKYLQPETPAINGVNDTDADFIRFINACGGLDNAKQVLNLATPLIEKNGIPFLSDLYKYMANYGKK